MNRFVLTPLALLTLATLTFAQQPKSSAPPPDPLLAKLVKETGLPPEQVQKLLKALGPILAQELKQGKDVPLAGLGSFRVVAIAEHKERVEGRPIVVPTTYKIEFLPSDGLKQAATGPNVKPAVTIKEPEFEVNPHQTPGQKVGPTRSPGIRTGP